MNIRAANHAAAAGQHDGFVITPQFHSQRTGHLFLEGAEVATQVRAPEFIIECGGTQRTLEHDIQRRCDACRPAMVALPGSFTTGNAEIGYGKTTQPRLGFCTAPGGALVADFTPGTGRRTGERRNGGRVVVGLHLHHPMPGLCMRGIMPCPGIRKKALHLEAFGHGCIVIVGRQDPFRAGLPGFPDHAKQRVLLCLPVYYPAGVEYLVPAMLGIRLGKHHQFDVDRVAPQGVEILDQVIDLVSRECQTEFDVGRLQCRASATENINEGKRCGFGMYEQGIGVIHVKHNRLRHAVMDQRQHGSRLCIRQCRSVAHFKGIDDAPLHTAHFFKPAVMNDVGGLAGPGRDGPRTGDDNQRDTVHLPCRPVRPVRQ